MVLETLSSSNEFSNFIIYDTITAEASSGGGGYLENIVSVSHQQQQQQHQQHDPAIACENNCDNAVMMMKKTSTRKRQCCSSEPETSGSKVQSNNKKRRRRKARVCKNKEEAETQRITHINVERNRRKQMNEHLAVLRSLMPESYVQRGDQASIVGGAIEFVKELEHLLQSLEARKLQLLQQQVAAAQQAQNNNTNEDNNNNNNNNVAISKLMLQQPPFAQFFVYPQYTWSQTPNKYTSKTKAAIADIEVTLIETHANLRILTRIIRPGQLTKIVAGFQTLCLTILHLNVTTIDPLVFYSISAKVEEGFQLGSVEGIATAVHNLLERIDEEASLCC